MQLNAISVTGTVLMVGGTLFLVAASAPIVPMLVFGVGATLMNVKLPAK